MDGGARERDSWATSRAARAAHGAGGLGAPEHGALAALRWALTRRPHRWPDRVGGEVRTELPEEWHDGEVAWLLVGHSTVLLRVGRWHLLLDPIWSERCSPLSWAGPRRVRPPALAFAALPPIDLVLISHTHYDHCDRPTLERLAQEHGPLFVAGTGVREILEHWGIRCSHELAWWEELCWSEASDPDASHDALSIRFLPTRHFSARGLTDRNRTAWGGFWIQGRGGAHSDSSSGNGIYFCGDSGLDRELFAETRRRCGSPDLAFLPIGAYDPRWFMRVVHVNPEEAVEIHRILGARCSVAIHHGTFQLTDEPVDEPVRRLERAAEARRLRPGEFTAPDFGLPQWLEERPSPGSTQVSLE